MVTRRTSAASTARFSRNSFRPMKQLTPSVIAGPSRRRRLTAASETSSSNTHQRVSSGTPLGTPVHIITQANTAGASERVIDDDTLDHRILAIDRDKHSIGCSYYVAQESVLFVMEDINGPEKEIVDSCNYFSPDSFLGLTKPVKLDIQPTIVLLSPRLEIPNLSFHRSNLTELSGMSTPLQSLQIAS